MQYGKQWVWEQRGDIPCRWCACVLLLPPVAARAIIASCMETFSKRSGWRATNVLYGPPSFPRKLASSYERAPFPTENQKYSSSCAAADTPGRQCQLSNKIQRVHDLLLFLRTTGKTSLLRFSSFIRSYFILLRYTFARSLFAIWM